jgi:hypothetical protein
VCHKDSILSAFAIFFALESGQSFPEMSNQSLGFGILARMSYMYRVTGVCRMLAPRAGVSWSMNLVLAPQTMCPGCLLALLLALQLVLQSEGKSLEGTVWEMAVPEVCCRPYLPFASVSAIELTRRPPATTGYPLPLHQYRSRVCRQ